MKVLVAVDGSEFSRKLLAWLAAHDEWMTAANSYTLLHVATPVPPRAAAVLDKQLLKDHYAAETDKVFKPMRRYFANKPLQVSFASLVGVAGETIAKTAEKGAYDLVVMGSHGHGVLLNLVLGSVATQVLARCKVPVLLVR